VLTEKVSIIVPTLNAEATVEHCLQSVLNQTYERRETIVVDGGSTDRTLSILDGFRGRINLIKDASDRGVYDAMNKGVRAATGDWVYFLGADDSLASVDILERIFSRDLAAVDVVYGDVFMQRSRTRYAGRFDIYKLSKKNICHQAIFYRRRLFSVVGMFDLDYPLWADYEMNLRIFGTPDLRHRYLDVVVANYSEGGRSSATEDPIFLARRRELLKRYLGVPGIKYGCLSLYHRLRGFRNGSVSISRSLERKAIRFLRRRGYFVEPAERVDNPVRRRAALLREYAIDLVLDVGANVGQFSGDVRGSGYAGRIVSFEPVADAFGKLESLAQHDPLWTVLPCGLGSSDAVSRMNVAGNSVSSSFLDMLPRHAASAPESGYVGTESVRIRTLDAVFDEVRGTARSVWLKIDTQGYELEVLSGAHRALSSIATIQVEMSLEPLYKGGPLFDDVHAVLRGKGYRLTSIELGHRDPHTGQLLQVDGIFHRSA